MLSFSHRIWLSIKKTFSCNRWKPAKASPSDPHNESVPLDTAALGWRTIRRLFGYKLGKRVWIFLLVIISAPTVIALIRDTILPAKRILAATVSAMLPIPKARPGEYTVAVAHLTNDPDGKYEALIVQDLQAIKWVETLPLNKTISFEPNRFHETTSARSDIAKAHQYLKSSGAQILVWGSVLRSDQSSVPDLMLTSSDATEAFEGRFRLKEDLDLPSLFWNDLGDLLYVEVAAQFMNSLNH